MANDPQERRERIEWISALADWIGLPVECSLQPDVLAALIELEVATYGHRPKGVGPYVCDD